MQSVGDRQVRSFAARFAARRGEAGRQALPRDVVDTGLRADRPIDVLRPAPRRSAPWSKRLMATALAMGAIGAGAAGYFTVFPERWGALSTSGFTSALDRAAARNGFSLAQIALSGHKRASDKEIYRTLRLGHEGSLFSYDAAAGCARVKELAWIKDCTAVRVLPDQLSVQVSERQPFAVWQRRGFFFLIDREGRSLEPVPPRAFTHLPLVIGEGASEAAAQIVVALKQVPDVFDQVHSIERIAKRRWSLNLKQGTTVLLPAGDGSVGLKRLSGLSDRQQLLAAKPRILDLRLPGRITLRPAKQPGPRKTVSRGGERSS